MRNISHHQSTKSTKNDEEEKKDESLDESSTVKIIHHTRRLSVQDRINLFKSKQKEKSNFGGNKSDERQSKGRKKEMFSFNKQPALTTSPKPVSAGSEQRQKSFGVEDDLEVQKDLQRNPFLLSGSKLIEGIGTMLVTSVGLNTAWGFKMEIPLESDEESLFRDT